MTKLLTLLFLLCFKSFAFETAALKASILSCYGFFIEKNKSLEDKQFTILINSLESIFNNRTFEGFDREEYINEGIKLALKIDNHELIAATFIGCKQNLSSLKNILLK